MKLTGSNIDHYRKGDAVGRSDINSGGVFFRFYEDEFFIDDETLAKTPLVMRKFRDYLLAKISDVRKYG